MSFFLDQSLDETSLLPKGFQKSNRTRTRRFPGTQHNPPSRTVPLILLPQNEIQQLERFLSSALNNEIEASIGRFHGSRFISGVQLRQFHTVFSFMRERRDVDEEEEVTKEYRNGFFRKIVYDDNSIQYQRKRRQENIDSKQWFFRIRNSTEESVFEPTEEELESVNFSDISLREGQIIEEASHRVIRFKTRHTFIGHENGLFDGLRVDLTLVVQDNGINVRKIYEIEIERIKSSVRGGPDAEKFLRIIKLFLMKMQNVLIDELTLSGESMLMSSSQIRDTARSYNNLFSHDIQRRQLSMYPDQFFEFKNKPKALDIRQLLNASSYAITIKYDGIRKFIYVSQSGIYTIEPRYIVQKIAEKSTISGTLLDGELIESENGQIFYVFDILFYESTDVRAEPLRSRLNYIENAIGHLSNLNITVRAKTFFLDENFYNAATRAAAEEENVRKEGIPIDGWILQPKHLPYKNESTYKWKPEELLTIDFYLENLNIPDEDSDPSTYALYVKARKEREIFRGTRAYPYKGSVTFSSEEFPPGSMNGMVVEMGWDNDTSNFFPIRLRLDRTDPNFKDWAIGLWKDIQNPIPKSTLLGTDLRVVRAWFNDKKRDILSLTTHSSEIVIDVGSGRGGDLGKWKKKNLQVFAIDPNEDNINEMRRRQKVFDYDKITYIPTGIQNTDLIVAAMKAKAEDVSNANWRADEATAFFSLQFLAESEVIMDQMVRTFKKTIKPGGLVMGIVMDGVKVEDLIEDLDEYVSESGAWSIKKGRGWEDDDEFEFGKSIIVHISEFTSMVHDVYEFIFNFNIFSAKMIRAGFSLEDDGFYQTPAELPDDSKLWISLQRHFIFRKKDIMNYIALPMLPMDQISTFESAFKNINLVRIGSVADGSCFFHGLLRAFSKKYTDMNLIGPPVSEKKQKAEIQAVKGELVKSIKDKFKRHRKIRDEARNERMIYISDIRHKLAQNLSLEIYKTLGEGVLAEVMTERYQSVARRPEDAEMLGWAIYLKKLSDCSEWVGEEAIEYVSNVFGIDIYIMSDTTRNIYLLGANCDLIYKFRPSVVLMNLNNIHYETVGRVNNNGDIQTLFAPDDPWIRKLHSKLCDD